MDVRVKAQVTVDMARPMADGKGADAWNTVMKRRGRVPGRLVVRRPGCG